MPSAGQECTIANVSGTPEVSRPINRPIFSVRRHTRRPRVHGCGAWRFHCSGPFPQHVLCGAALPCQRLQKHAECRFAAANHPRQPATGNAPPTNAGRCSPPCHACLPMPRLDHPCALCGFASYAALPHASLPRRFCYPATPPPLPPPRRKPALPQAASMPAAGPRALPCRHARRRLPEPEMPTRPSTHLDSAADVLSSRCPPFIPPTTHTSQNRRTAYTEGVVE